MKINNEALDGMLLSEATYKEANTRLLEALDEDPAGVNLLVQYAAKIYPKADVLPFKKVYLTKFMLDSLAFLDPADAIKLWTRLLGTVRPFLLAKDGPKHLFGKGDKKLEAFGMTIVRMLEEMLIFFHTELRKEHAEPFLVLFREVEQVRKLSVQAKDFKYLKPRTQQEFLSEYKGKSANPHEATLK
jgi:hypothetical protein